MFRGHRNFLLFTGVLIICSLTFQQHVEGKPWSDLRRKRIIGHIGSGMNFGPKRIPSFDNNDIYRRKRQEDYEDESIPYEDDAPADDDEREARQAGGRYKPTYPPFPGDDDDYDRWTQQPDRGTTTTTTTKPVVSDNNDTENKEGERKSNWFKHHFGRARNYIKDQYHAVSSFFG